MPFAGGTYTPPGPPAYPPATGDIISAAYYIEVINDIASALSLTFLRDGSLAMVAGLDMGANEVKNIGSGNAAAPGLRFDADADTGWFLEAAGRLAASIGGVNRLEITEATIKASVTTSVSVAYAATITYDQAAGMNFHTTLTGNPVIANFANENIGSMGAIVWTQDGTGNRQPTFGTDWIFPFGVKTVNGTAASKSVLFYYTFSSTITFAAIVGPYTA